MILMRYLTRLTIIIIFIIYGTIGEASCKTMNDNHGMALNDSQLKQHNWNYIAPLPVK